MCLHILYIKCYTEIKQHLLNVLSSSRRTSEISSLVKFDIMMTSSNGNLFRATGHLYGEFTGHRWIPHTKVSGAELWCFLWSAPEKTNNREAGDLKRHRTHYDVTDERLDLQVVLRYVLTRGQPLLPIQVSAWIANEQSLLFPYDLYILNWHIIIVWRLQKLGLGIPGLPGRRFFFSVK